MPKKVAMEEKILRAGHRLRASCMFMDIEHIVLQGSDPNLAKDFTDFVKILVEAGDKKMYSSRENALRKLIGY